eukprot:3899313-Amphidinium_carterae.1
MKPLYQWLLLLMVKVKAYRCEFEACDLRKRNQLDGLFANPESLFSQDVASQSRLGLLRQEAY